MRPNMKNKIELNGSSILVTGSPGFIGANLVLRLLSELSFGTIVSLDNMNDYYDPALKKYRLGLIEDAARSSSVKHVFVQGSICDNNLVDSLFRKYKFSVVVHLAAQAGVRYSIEHPEVYMDSNMIGFFNILEACRHSYEYASGDYSGVRHFIYASSSSVYGGNQKTPFSVEDSVDHPVSFYAATKKSNELFAYAYSTIYGIPSTSLRFFTVIGAAGRPDMALMGFTAKLCRGEVIKIFNYGNMKRDFTDVDDITEGVFRVMQGAPMKESGSDGVSIPPHAIYNIGGGKPENLLEFVTILQEELVKAHILPADYDFESHRELLGMQPGDVPVTYADTEALERDYGFTPQIPLRETIRKYCEWHYQYYGPAK